MLAEKTNRVYGGKLFCAIVLLICVCMFLSCGVKRFKEMTVLVYMTEAHQTWFCQQVRKFGLKHNWQIKISMFNKVDDLLEILRLETQFGEDNIGLVYTPSEMVQPLVKLGLMKSLEEIHKTVEIEKDLLEYLPLTRIGCEVEGDCYYLPGHLEVFLLFYLKPRIHEVVEHWEIYRSQINQLLRRYNRYGLPRDYQLEADPNQWDSFDLAVIGYYFSHTPYNGLLVPRLAHRSRRYAGTVNELATRIFAMGGSNNDLSRLLTDPVVDMLQWESLFVKEQFYHPEMWESGWGGNDLWRQIVQERVFVVCAQQNELFLIHESASSLGRCLIRSDDIGVAVLPKGVSLEIGSDRQPRRVGTRKSALHGWCWGIPVTSPDPKFSYKLARFVTSFALQMKETFTFGTMPVRQDVLDKIGESSEISWKQQIFRMIQKQLEMGVESVPNHPAWGNIGVNLLDVWYDICIQNHWVERQKIKSALENYLKMGTQPSTY